MDCALPENAEQELCKNQDKLCTEFYMKMQNDRTDTNVPKHCLTWIPPNCAPDSSFAHFHMCTDCFKPRESAEAEAIKGLEDICNKSECTITGGDRGWDICNHFVPDCNKQEHTGEDACLNCTGKKNAEDTRCKNRDCTRESSDKYLAVCKTWRADCTKKEHKEEDICLQCTGDDENHFRCLAKDWDCDGEDAKEQICYYSTTSTEAPSNDDVVEGGYTIDFTGNNDTNIFLKIKGQREDYLTTITVPTFAGE